VIRSIVGFHRDDLGDWVAELSCLHNQHVRHRPPFQDRAWVLDEARRREQVGSAIECPLCDRAELPDGLSLRARVVGRSDGPDDIGDIPRGLLREHVVPEGSWGLLRVLEGVLGFRVEDGEAEILIAVSARAIPPGVRHRVELIDRVAFELELLSRQSQ
jgi:tellurite resistance-related uncharacterized protein